jgi:hypothetical protein
VIDVNAVEAIWIAVNAVASALTFANLRAALADWRVVRRYNGRARELQAGSNVRRDAVRLLINFALLATGLIAVARPGDVPLSPGVVLLMLAALGLMANSLLDRRDRRELEALLQEEILAERYASKPRG